MKYFDRLINFDISNCRQKLSYNIVPKLFDIKEGRVMISDILFSDSLDPINILQNFEPMFPELHLDRT